MGLLEDYAGGEDQLSDFDETSDQLYDESFGPGQFTANQYGGRNFTPARGGGGGGGPVAPPRGNIMESILSQVSGGPGEPGIGGEPYYAKGGTAARPQIHNLRQLGAVAAALKNVPEELKTRVLSHLLGLPFKSNREQTYENAIRGTAARAAVAMPQQQEQQRIARERLGIAQQGAERTAQRQQQRDQMQQLLNKFNMAYKITGRTAQTENQKNLLQHQREMEKHRIVGTIATLSKALDDMGPTDPRRDAFQKILIQQQKKYHENDQLEEKFNPPPEVGGAPGEEPLANQAQRQLGGGGASTEY